ncbi:MAG: hypothetical protein EP344_03145 [Bacteroidetes bacterium]|nr:MAG: hypothetical protein EP344_03145 [Bacteroidota bacterium]
MNRLFKYSDWLVQPFLVLLLLVFVSFPADAQVNEQTTIDFTSGLGIGIGKGFDLIQGSGMPRVPITDTEHDVYPGGQLQNIGELLYIRNSLDLEKAFGFEISASADFLLFGGSYYARFLEEHKFNQQSVYFIVRSSVINSEDLLVNDPQLTAEARSVLEDGDLNTFHQMYGTHLVYGFVTGGEYYGIIEFEAKSEEDKRAFDEEFSAFSIGTSFSASIKSRFYQLSRQYRMKVYHMSKGGLGLPSAPRDIEEMYAIAHDFPQRMVSEGVPIRVILSPYTIFQEYATIYSDIDLDRRFALIKLNYDYIDYYNMRNNIDYIVSNPDEYRFKPETRSKDMDRLRKQSRDISYRFAEIDATRRIIMDRTRPIPPFPMSARDYGANVLLPVRYQAFMPKSEYVVTLNSRTLFPLKHERGDWDMAGTQHSIGIIGMLTLNGDRGLTLKTTCAIDQFGSGDNTRFTGVLEEKLIVNGMKVPGVRDDLPPMPDGIVIKEVSLQLGQLSARTPSNNTKWVWHKGQYLISKAQCRTNTQGREGESPNNGIGCYVHYSPTVIRLQHTEDARRLPIEYYPAATPEVNILMHETPAKNTLRQRVISLDQWKRVNKVPNMKKLKVKKEMQRLN